MFDEPMVALGDFANFDSSHLVLEPNLPGSYRWLNQFTLAFVPTEPISSNLTLKATLKAGIKSLSGTPLREDVSGSFTLPNLRAIDYDEVTDKEPEKGLVPIWTVYLTQNVMVEALDSYSFISYEENGEVVKVPVKWSSLNNKNTRSRGYEYFVEAQSPLPKNTKYQLTLAKGFAPKEYLEPLAEDIFILSGQTYGPLEVSLETYGVTDGIMDAERGYFSLQFSNPAKYPQVLDYIEINPPHPSLAAFKKEYADSISEDGGEAQDGTELGLSRWQIFFWSPLSPNTTYEITVKPGLEDIYQQKLTSQATFSVDTASYTPKVNIDSTGGTLESSSAPKLRLEFYNLAEAKVYGWALDEKAAIQWFTSSWHQILYTYGLNNDALNMLDSLVKAKMLMVSPNSDSTKGPAGGILDLDALFGNDIKGKVLVVGFKDYYGRSSSGTFQITDLGLTAKIGRENSLAWVTSLASGKPLAQVQVRLWDKTGKVLAEALTDENGLAQLPGGLTLFDQDKANSNANPVETEDDLFITATFNGDLAFWYLDWQNNFNSWDLNIDYDDLREPFGKSPFANWLLTSQPIYKKGETAKLKIISRRVQGDDYVNLSPDATVKVTIEDPYGNNVFVDEDPEITPYGAVLLEYTIKEEDPYGNFAVYLEITGGDSESAAKEQVGYLKVRYYRPPAFDFSFPDFPKEKYAGDKVEFPVVAKYHYGSPFPNAQVDLTLSSEILSDFSFPNHPGFTFSDFFALEEDDESYWQNFAPKNEATDTAISDSEGKVSFSATLPIGSYPLVRTFSLTAVSQDVDSREVAHTESFIVHPAHLYVGVKLQGYLYQVGSDVNVDTIVTDTEGVISPGQEIELTLYRRTWSTSRRLSPGGIYNVVSKSKDEEIAKQTLVSAEAPLETTFNLDKSGFYWVQAKIKDQGGMENRASGTFYAFGGDFASWQVRNDDLINLVPDKTSYAPGDTAKILVQSPFTTGTGLLTVERAGIREQRSFDLTSDSPVLEIPITQDDSPNIFVSVILARGRISESFTDGVDLGKPTLRKGYTQLYIPSKANLLEVKATANASEYKPGAQVEIDLSVQDSSGNPFKDAEVAVTVVDKAIIQLGGDDAFHPETLFDRKEPLTVMTYSTLETILGRINWANKGAPTPAGGGGGFEDGSDANLRRDFRTVAHFEPAVVLDEGGKAKVSFKLPDNLTTFKVYAVATGNGRITGTGESDLLVTKELLLRSSLPNYAGVGDEFSAGVIVTNRGKTSGQARVDFSTEGLELTSGDPSQTVTVEAGKSLEVFFPVKALKVQKAKVNFQVEMNGESDRVEYSLNVSETNRLIAEASYGELTPKGEEGDGTQGGDLLSFSLPETIDMSRGNYSFEVAPSFIGSLNAATSWLESYPYDCTEQLTSKGMGALYQIKLKEILDLDPETVEKLENQVKNTIERLKSMRNYDNGFSTWASGYGDRSYSSAYLTAYVLDFLVDAKEEFPSSDLDNFIRQTADFLELVNSGSKRGFPGWYGTQAAAIVRIKVAASLSNAGRPQDARVESFFLNKNALCPLAKAYLLLAAAALPPSQNRTDYIIALIPELVGELEISSGMARVKAQDAYYPYLFSYGEDDLTAQFLLAFTYTAPYHELYPYLVRAVAASSKGIGNFSSTYRTALILKALSKYALVPEQREPNLDLTVLLGDKTVLEQKFTSLVQKPEAFTVPLSDLGQTRKATFNLTGTGSLWYCQRLTYAFLKPDLSPVTGNGITLTRSYEVVKGGKETFGTSFHRGDIVKVTVTLLTTTQRFNLVLEDRIPAGFEPIDFGMKDVNPSILELLDSETGTDGIYNFLYAWYDHEEIAPDRVSIFATLLEPGVYSYSYLVRPVTPGSYVTPGPIAEEMYAQENFGRGAGETLVVEK
jgi:uncharacterized protein YfaS (alpha-2-macroglobulin family)